MMNDNDFMAGSIRDSILLDDVVIGFYLVWGLFKFVFYILPMVDLIKIKNYEGKGMDIAITYMIILPVLEFVAYYYVVTRIIEKIVEQEKGRRLSGILSCQIYGIAAGILNTILVIMCLYLSSTSHNPLSSDIGAVFMLTMIIFSSWLYISYLHLRSIFIVRRLLISNRTI